MSHGIERPESFDEFPARGLIILAEVWITKRTEQEQNRVEVSIPIDTGSPRPPVGMGKDESSWAQLIGRQQSPQPVCPEA